MRSRAMIVTLLIGALVSACADQKYVLPGADGGATPSPPSLEGQIVRVGVEEIEVRPSDSELVATSSVVVGFDQTTQLFTVYGGRVSASELVQGQRIRVWFRKPEMSAADPLAHAAVIEFASLDPQDAWP